MEHSTALQKLCWVCGKCIITKSVKAKYLCTDYRDSLEAVYGIDITHDNTKAHPQYFCHACKNVLHRTGLRHKDINIRLFYLKIGVNVLVTAALCVHILLQFRREGDQNGWNAHQDDHKLPAPGIASNISVLLHHPLPLFQVIFHHKFVTIIRQSI